jgi:hypothetical protein
MQIDQIYSEISRLFALKVYVDPKGTTETTSFSERGKEAERSSSPAFDSDDESGHPHPSATAAMCMAAAAAAAAAASKRKPPVVAVPVPVVPAVPRLEPPPASKALPRIPEASLLDADVPKERQVVPPVQLKPTPASSVAALITTPTEEQRPERPESPSVDMPPPPPPDSTHADTSGETTADLSTEFPPLETIPPPIATSSPTLGQAAQPTVPIRRPTPPASGKAIPLLSLR